MPAFRDYADSFLPGCDAAALDITRTETGYGLSDDNGMIRTPGGHAYQHRSEEFIRLLLTDWHLFPLPGLKPLSAPVLYGYLKDVLEAGPDPFPADWEKGLPGDPFVAIRSEGHQPEPRFGPDDPMFGFAFATNHRLVMAVNAFAGRIMGEVDLDESVNQPFTTLLWLSYDRLPLASRAAVQGLSEMHQSGIVLPLMVVSGDIDAVEYAKGLIALGSIETGNFQSCVSEVTRVRAFLHALDDRRSHRQHLTSLISEGEGDTVEFKSTLRWDIRAGKTNPAIERACLKTLSAFLNSSGGNLIIGVRDDGTTEGIETDKFANEDKFLLHLWTLIRICLGRDVSPWISTLTAERDGKTVCLVTCLPAGRPVFLRQPGFDEEMYIRVGPSSHAMDISEALKYVAGRFPGKAIS